MELHGTYHNSVFIFMSACIFGILFALVWRKYEKTVEMSMVYNHYYAALHNTGYSKWLEHQGLRREFISEEQVSFPLGTLKDAENEYLYNKVSVLCMIFTTTHKSAYAIKNTWSKHCNIVKFFGSFLDEKIPVLQVPSPGLYEAYCRAFSHIWKKYNKEFKWVLIVDDSTFALVDNLRYYVASLNSSHPYYLGHPVKDFSTLYNLGNAGIALSHGAVALLYSEFPSGSSCSDSSIHWWHYDQALGKLLKKFDVTPVDTRDSQRRGRFNPFSVEDMLIPGSISIFNSYWRTSVFLSNEGTDCCSDNAITFHDTDDTKMYLLEYLLYHLAVFQNSPLGLGNKPPNVNKYPDPEENMLEGVVYGKPYFKLIDQNHKKHKKKYLDKGLLEESNEINDGILTKIWKDFFGT